MTPLPYQKIAVLVMVFLGDSLCMSVVLPFVPFMVKTYLGLPPDQDYLVGYYAGAVAGAYIAGQLCTAPLWGALSDRVGRRPVMLACLFLSAACLLAFGAAPDLRFALVARFAHGLCSGNVVVAKSMMADLTDETNEADAFVYVGVTFGAGAMLGPLIGGALCEPATKYAGLPLMGLWAERPYLLPCAVVAAVTLLDLAAAAVLLEESKPETPDAPADGVSDAAADAGVRELLRDPGSPFRAVCASFVLFGLCFMAFQEVFPVFGRAPVAEGGLHELLIELRDLGHEAALLLAELGELGLGPFLDRGVRRRVVRGEVLHGLADGLELRGDARAGRRDVARRVRAPGATGPRRPPAVRRRWPGRRPGREVQILGAEEDPGVLGRPGVVLGEREALAAAVDHPRLEFHDVLVRRLVGDAPLPPADVGHLLLDARDLLGREGRPRALPGLGEAAADAVLHLSLIHI